MCPYIKILLRIKKKNYNHPPGILCYSITTTVYPLLANAEAADNPEMPLPIIIVSIFYGRS